MAMTAMAATSIELLERGPPASVKTQLRRFAERADVCRQGALQIARDLGMI